MTHQTPQEASLAQALRARGIPVEQEHFDNYKHVDMAVLPAKLYIEVGGLYHLTDPQQLKSDLNRDHFSDGDNFATIRVPNAVVDHHLDELADSIVAVARERMK